MYIRVLTSQFDTEYNVTRKDSEIAKGDLVTALEMDGRYSTSLENKIWYDYTATNLPMRMTNMMKYVLSKLTKFDDEFDVKLASFQKEFAIWHKYDYMLYLSGRPQRKMSHRDA